MWIKWSPRALKISYSLLSEVWLMWEGPGFKLISPESNSSNLKKESLFLYLKFDSAKNTKALWIWDVCMNLAGWLEYIIFYQKVWFCYGQQKYNTTKECYYPLIFVSKKHTCKHDGEYEKD